MKVIYPAIVHKDENSYWIEFPDLPGCLTDGQSILETMINAGEVLGEFIALSMEENLEIAPPSDINALEFDEGFSTYVISEIGKVHYKKKAVKKTVSIPQYLSDEAKRQHISLSAILQNALARGRCQVVRDF